MPHWPKYSGTISGPKQYGLCSSKSGLWCILFHQKLAADRTRKGRDEHENKTQLLHVTVRTTVVMNHFNILHDPYCVYVSGQVTEKTGSQVQRVIVCWWVLWWQPYSTLFWRFVRLKWYQHHNINWTQCPNIRQLQSVMSLKNRAVPDSLVL